MNADILQGFDESHDISAPLTDNGVESFKNLEEEFENIKKNKNPKYRHIADK